MSLATTTLLNVVTSHALTTGLFETVNGHQPENPPGNGLVAAVWLESIAPARGASGLAQTSALVVLNVRVYLGMLAEPADDIDVQVTAAVDALMTAYSSDFEVGGNARCVDLLGMAGTPLSARAGYLMQDGKQFRVMTITLPILVNDVWGQVA